MGEHFFKSDDTCAKRDGYTLVTMTVYEALHKKKVLKQGIDELLRDRNFSKIPYVNLAKGDNDTLPSGIKIDMWETEMIALTKSIDSKIENYKEIESKINLSNSKTYVNIAGIDMTITEAIKRKNFLEIEKTIYINRMNNLQSTTDVISNYNSDLEEKFNDHISSLKSLENSKNYSETIASIRKEFYSKNEWKLLDPMNIKESTEKILKNIEDFESEVNVKINISNCNTNVDIYFKN